MSEKGCLTDKKVENFEVNSVFFCDGPIFSKYLNFITLVPDNLSIDSNLSVTDNTTFTDTGSAEISTDSYVPYFKNIKSEYRTSEISKFRIGVRPQFPTKTYTTESFYLTNNRLPTSSFYSIIDSVTNDTIIKYDTNGTRIDCDSNGSFFKLRMDSFMPERYYKIELKIERDGGDDIQTFDDFYFKVVN